MTSPPPLVPSQTFTPLQNAAEERAYAPLSETARLFAGWLLAWYGLVFVAGALQQDGRLSPDLPLLEALYNSNLVLTAAFTTFLFLLLQSIHRITRTGYITGFFLTLVWLGGTYGFWVNVQ